CVGNGSAELRRKLMELLPGIMGVILPSFEEYLVRAYRIESFFPFGPGYRYTVSDLKTFFEDKGVPSLLLLNPANPSGSSIPYEDLISLTGWTQERSIRLIVDESFFDFSEGGEETSLIDHQLLPVHN
ncbi:aminotransferase class I/II-fold pyridoxal phosphate-dependent enzyme, partial [Bacteroides fragilis]|uniref:aminotransferase class I/II-fold pyridoxal phosphate-dependent enzyme n=1 Tax=Bacteroides fragilis TaxID=817 RepID=UPI000A9CD537